MNKQVHILKSIILSVMLILFTLGSYGQCDYTIALYDDYGDGWNGGAVTVYINGIAAPSLTGLTLGSGAGPATYTIAGVVDGDQITTTYTAGSWSYENEYYIYNASGIEVASDGTGGASPTGISSPVIAGCPVSLDAGISAITSADCPGLVDISATLFNYGTDTIFSATLQWSIDSVMQTPLNWSDTLCNLGSETLNIGTLSATAGTAYTIKVWSCSPNGGTDLNNQNDTLTYILTINSLILAAPHYDDLESENPGFSATLNNGWTVSTSSNPKWEMEDATGNNENSTATGPYYDHTTEGLAGGMYVYFETSGGSQGDFSYLTSPCLDLSGITSPKLMFWYHMYGASMGSLSVEELSGGSWSQTWSISGQQQAAGNSPWSSILIPLNPNTEKVRFKGVRGSSYTGDISLDDIRIFDPADNDVGISHIPYPVNASCGNAMDSVQLLVSNTGLLPQTGTPVVVYITSPGGSNIILNDTIHDTIAPFTVYTHWVNFFSSLQGGTYSITAYTALNSDTCYNNDTTIHLFETYIPNAIPHNEHMEGGGTYNWNMNNFWVDVPGAHGLLSSALSANLYSGNPLASANTTRKTGPIGTNSYLTFEYRITDFTGGAATVIDNDTIRLSLSTCSMPDTVIYTIDSTNHIVQDSMRRVTLPLNCFAGMNVFIGFDCKHHSGDYYVDIDNIAISEPPLVDLGADVNICSGQSHILDAGTDTMYTYTYNWYCTAGNIDTTQTISVNSSGTYYVSVTNEFGLTDIDTIIVSVIPSPVVHLGTDTAICEGETLLLDPGTFDTYLWSNACTMQTINIDTSFNIGVNTIFVEVSENSCYGYDTINIEIKQNPLVSLGPDTVICENESILLDPGTFDTYLWSDTSSMQTLLVDASFGLGANNIYVEVSSIGCNGSDTIVVDILANPVVNLGPDTMLCIYNTLSLDAGNGYDSYLWSTGETTHAIVIDSTLGATSLTVEVMHNGCIGYDTIDISWDPCAGLDKHSLKTRVYPNPSKDFLFIEISQTGKSIVELYELNGKLVYSEEISGTKTRIDLGHFAKGVYHLRIRNEQKVETIKIIHH